MPYFEDIQELSEDMGEDIAIGYLVYNYARVVECVQYKPWTFSRAEVWFNGIKFEGVGFARQRQYPSLVIRPLKKFPYFRAVFAEADEWNAAGGKNIADIRALDNLCKNVKRRYRRWKHNKERVPISRPPLPDMETVEESVAPGHGS